MEKQIDKKKAITTKKNKIPVFFKILTGVVIIYLVVNFFGGIFLGMSSPQLATANSLAVREESSDWGIAGEAVELASFNEEAIMDDAGSMAPTKGMANMPPGADGSASSSQKRVFANEPVSIVTPEAAPAVDKKIIKNGLLRLKVESTEKSVEKIKEITKQYQGDVSSINIYRSGKNGLEGNIIVKVPVSKFEEAQKTIKKIADQVISSSENTNDVTEQYVDLQAQIRNKKAEEKTFRKLLERSGKLDDILSVTREVAKVRKAIDRLEGRIKVMEARTDMSTINISLIEYEQIVTNQDTWKPLRVVQKASRDLVIRSQKAIDDLIYFFIARLPILAGITLVIFIAYKVVLKIYRKVRGKK